MNRKLVFAALFSLCLTPSLFAQEGLPEPTKEHELLQKIVGEWTGKMQMYMEGPNSEPVTVECTETVDSLGPFWTRSELKYDFMGQTVTGMAMMGFDQSKGKFTGTWHDSMTPVLSTMAGEFDADSKTFTYHGEMPGPTGEMSKMKIVEVWETDDKKSFEMHMEIPGTDDYMKFLRIDYSRKK